MNQIVFLLCQKQPTALNICLLSIKIVRSKMDRNAPIFRERYPKKVLYFVKVNTNGKLETRTKAIVENCSDLTCTKKYALTEGPKRGGVNVGHLLSPPPPQSFYYCYGPALRGLLNACANHGTNIQLKCKNTVLCLY